GAAETSDPLGRRTGIRVQVMPDDIGRDPVVGELLSLSTYEVVIRRNDPQVGEVAVHFPRAGFIIQPAAGSRRIVRLKPDPQGKLWVRFQPDSYSLFSFSNAAFLAASNSSPGTHVGVCFAF